MSSDYESNPIVYRLDDLVALSRLRMRGMARWLNMFGILGLINAGLVFAVAPTVGQPIGFEVAALTLFLPLLCFALANVRLRSAFWLWVMRGGLKPQRYRITDEGLGVSTDDVDSTFRWPVFSDARLVDDRLFLFVNTRQAYIIPARAFDDPSGFKSFTAKALAWWAQGRNRD